MAATVHKKVREDLMPKRTMSAATLLMTTLLSVAGSATAAEVTSDRLINADKEPQNWLMNHRTYDAQRYSPLDRINTTNVRGLKLAYAVALGGTSTNANLESTPLAEDGYLYVVDHWGVLYKIDGRSGDVGRMGVWILARKSCRSPTVAQHCGAISSSPTRTIHPA